MLSPMGEIDAFPSHAPPQHRPHCTRRFLFSLYPPKMQTRNGKRRKCVRGRPKREIRYVRKRRVILRKEDSVCISIA